MKVRDPWTERGQRIEGVDVQYEESVDLIAYRFDPNADADAGADSGPSRRDFLQTLGAGLLIAATADALAVDAEAQPPRGGRRGGPRGGAGEGASTIAARLHIGADGAITVLTGKVECGQGARAELTQAAAEELRVAPDRIRLVMADTALVPDDGGTFGSRSTPATVPAIRQGCAAARDLLVKLAAQTWGIPPESVDCRDGEAVDPKSKRSLSYQELAANPEAAKAFATAMPPNVKLTPVGQWKTLGTSVPRPNGRAIVTGSHEFPSDVTRPQMLYGKVLRPPSFGAKLIAIDLGPAQAMIGATAVRDGDFVGAAALTSRLAQKAIDAIAATAKWETPPHLSSAQLFSHLREHVRDGALRNPYADEAAKAAKSLRRSYEVAYVQHAPMETRAAVAEWSANGSLTVWTASQRPTGVRDELIRAFGVPSDRVRVIIPDFGGGFGGKHSGECAVEAARLAKAAGKPVRLQWTRAEEFTWAQFRPAALIEAEAGLDESGALTTWHFVNVNSGGSSVQTPYRVAKNQCRFAESAAPLRHGSYRALASTANTFARECFMDELAELAGRDPLEFRLAHLEPGRLRDVLTAVAERFDWRSRSQAKTPNLGVGIACGTDKGSFVAACAEAVVRPEQGTIVVKRICQVFECGKILNPANLLAQVEGGIVMGLGPALREAMRFEKGEMLNAAFARYAVPRFADLPKLEIHLLDRPDLPSAGAGETPLIAVAPAIANAVHHALGIRIREMPMRLAKS